jgi:serine protease AprX
MQRALIAAIVALFGVFAGPAQASSTRATHIVQLEEGVSLAEGRAAVRAAGGRVADTLPLINGLAVRIRNGERLEDDPRVEAVSLNAGIRSQSSRFDPSLLGTAYPASVLAPPAWNTATGAGVGVAVIDTGIDGGLADFKNAQGESRVVASVVTNPDATTPNDALGHGTHVAGILAGDSTRRPAGDPLAGKYVGIAPDANLIAIKAADEAGDGTIRDAIYGVQFAVEHKTAYNIRIINMSVRSTVAESFQTDPLDAAVEAAYYNGILVVAAAGNNGTAPDATHYAPANDPTVLTVGAADDQGTPTRGDDTIASWSSTGLTQDGLDKPDIAAPGAQIVSTLAPTSAFATLCPECTVDGAYFRIGGTSMAAPVVAGVAALIAQVHPDWTPDQIKSTLIETGRNLDGGVDEVNAAAALAVTQPFSGANAGITPNYLVDEATGAIDYTRSSWGRSSWGRTEGPLAAGWVDDNFGCVCPGFNDSETETPRSSWGTKWLFKWNT